MTVVIYRDGIMAADTGAWEGDILVSTNHPKVYRLKNGGLLGMAGEDRDMQMFHAWADGGFPRPAPKHRPGRDLSAVTVDPDGKVTVWDDRLEPFVDTADWTVLGYHKEFVHGLLAAGLTAPQAVLVAIERCAFAGGVMRSMALKP